jgi:hypothetical protein
MGLKEIITQAAVAKAIKSLPPINTPIMDRFYASRKSYYKPVIGIDEVVEVAKAVPVIKRGGEPIIIGQGKGARTFIEAQPIEVKRTLGAAEINDIVAATNERKEAFLADQVDHIRKVVRSTAEGIAAQSLSGRIAWALRGGENSLYEIDFGAVNTVTPSTLFDAAGVKLSAVIDLLTKLSEKIQENGFGGNVKFDFGAKAYYALLNLVIALPNDARIRASVNGNTINLAGYELSLNASRYFDPIDNTYKYAIAPEKILAWDANAGFELRYLAVDNIAANFEPTPLYINAYQTVNGKSWIVEGESKPLPIPVVKAMATATVVA